MILICHERRSIRFQRADMKRKKKEARRKKEINIVA